LGCGSSVLDERDSRVVSVTFVQQGGWQHWSSFTLIIAAFAPPVHSQMPMLHHNGQPKTAAIRISDMMRLNMNIP
jgi:hypothetical protein